MTQQFDLFAGNQVDLFAAPPAMLVPAAEPESAPAPRLRRSIEARWALACTVGVRQDFLDVAMARPGEWLYLAAFRAVAQRHELSFCFGHALGLMARAGMLEEKPRYFGSDHPGKPGYEGFEHLYRWRFPLAAEAREGFGPCVS